MSCSISFYRVGEFFGRQLKLPEPKSRLSRVMCDRNNCHYILTSIKLYLDLPNTINLELKMSKEFYALALKLRELGLWFVGSDWNSGWGERLPEGRRRDVKCLHPRKSGCRLTGQTSAPLPQPREDPVAHRPNSRVCAEFPYSHYYHDEELILREEGLKRQKEEASETTTTETPTPQQHSTSTFLLQNMIS